MSAVFLLASIVGLALPANAKGKPQAEPKSGPDVAAACAISDLQGATACSGYYAGNLNGGSSGMVADARFALASLGFAWDGNMGVVEKISAFNGNAVAFSKTLYGSSFVSIHYGAGQGPAKVPGGTTGFYKIDALSGLAQLASRYGSLSNAVLYSTEAVPPPPVDPTGAVPEPLIWVQLIAGFSMVGAAMRRRNVPMAA